MLDSKYCVLALLEADGEIKERYEYTPQGERQVFVSAGANDPKAQTPMTQAPRAGAAKAYALCDIGFQGLMHDEVTGNIYQRAREYSPRLARFMQRDPFGYPDGMNTYAAYHVLYGGLDPLGLNETDGDIPEHTDVIEQIWGISRQQYYGILIEHAVRKQAHYGIFGGSFGYMRYASDDPHGLSTLEDGWYRAVECRSEDDIDAWAARQLFVTEEAIIAYKRYLVINGPILLVDPTFGEMSLEKEEAELALLAAQELLAAYDENGIVDEAKMLELKTKWENGQHASVGWHVIAGAVAAVVVERIGGRLFGKFFRRGKGAGCDVPSSNPSAQRIQHLFHKGELEGGRVSSVRTLSTGPNRATIEALDRSGKVWRFDVPEHKIQEWESQGLLTRYRDFDDATGLVNHELRFNPELSEKMQEYLITD